MYPWAVCVQPWLAGGAVTPGFVSQVQLVSVTVRVCVPERVHPVAELDVQVQACVLVHVPQLPGVYAVVYTVAVSERVATPPRPSEALTVAASAPDPVRVHGMAVPEPVAHPDHDSASGSSSGSDAVAENVATHAPCDVHVPECERVADGGRFAARTLRACPAESVE